MTTALNDHCFQCLHPHQKHPGTCYDCSFSIKCFGTILELQISKTFNTVLRLQKRVIRSRPTVSFGVLFCFLAHVFFFYPILTPCILLWFFESKSKSEYFENLNRKTVCLFRLADMLHCATPFGGLRNYVLTRKCLCRK